MRDKGDWIFSQGLPRQDAGGPGKTVFPYEVYDIAYFAAHTGAAVKGGVRQ